jgi:hypothetical protein
MRSTRTREREDDTETTFELSLEEGCDPQNTEEDKWVSLQEPRSESEHQRSIPCRKTPGVCMGKRRMDKRRLGKRRLGKHCPVN